MVSLCFCLSLCFCSLCFCALVCGPDKSYLWFLAHSPKIDDDLKKRLIDKTTSLGFDTTELIRVLYDH